MVATANPLPEAVQARLREFWQQVPSFPGWDKYEAGRTARSDPLEWAAVASRESFDAAIAAVFARTGIAYTPLSQTTCHSMAAAVFLGAARGANQDVLRLPDTYGPVPVAILGHLLVVAHYDPDNAVPDFLPRHLCAPIWVPVDDYLAIRDDFRDRARSLQSAINDLSADVTPPNGQLSTLRGYLTWVSRQPTLGVQDRNAVEFLTALPDSELLPGRLSADMYAAFTVAKGDRPRLAPAVAVRVDETVLAKANKSRLAEIGVLPYAASTRHILVMASDPDKPVVTDEIARTYPGLKILVTGAPADGIKYHLQAANGKGAAVAAGPTTTEEDLSDVKFRVDPSQMNGKSARALGASQLGDLVQFVYCDATTQRASDIHIDLFMGYTRIRYVIDGEPQVVHTLARDMAMRIANWLREQVCKKDSDSQAPAAPQEGSFSYAYMGKRVTSRVAIAYKNMNPQDPKIVLRILDRSAGITDLSLLNLSRQELAIIRRNITAPQGMVIVSGPTGTGKSTTLMACMQDLNRPQKIVCTIEDPIEYILPGIIQIAAASKASERTSQRILFEEAIRLLLRMDPDIIMVGEMRDLATVNAGIDASNTGHMILATLHANSAPDIIKRLISIGADRTHLGENLKLLTAQRLVRRLCSCYRRVPASDELKRLFDKQKIEHTGYVGAKQGCPRCRNTGYHGRQVVMEMLEMNYELADLVSEGASNAKIREAALATGYETLYTAGLRKVATEVTTFDAFSAKIDARG